MVTRRLVPVFTLSFPVYLRTAKSIMMPTTPTLLLLYGRAHHDALLRIKSHKFQQALPRVNYGADVPI